MSHAEIRKMARKSHDEKVRAFGGDVKEDKAMIKSAIAQHEKNDHPGTKPTRLHLASGGAVEGEASKPRMDKRARGGSMKKKAGTHVNVIVAPSHPQPVPVPMGGGAGGPPPMGPPPGAAGMMPPPGAGGPPGMGGPKPFARGGTVKMDAGAGGGLGRMEKAKAYGGKTYSENEPESEDSENESASEIDIGVKPMSPPDERS